MSNLSRSEANDLAECEAVIERGLATFVEVGTALLKIRDCRLYRETYGTFEVYCQERWGWGRNYVNKQIAAAEVAKNLGTVVPTERVARPLASLTPDRQRAVWSQATEEFGQPTAAQVQATREKLFPATGPLPGQGTLFEEEPEKEEPRTPEQQAAYMLDWLCKEEENWNLFWVSFDRKGGVDKLASNMTGDQILYWIELFEHYSERTQEIIVRLRRKLQ